MFGGGRLINGGWGKNTKKRIRPKFRQSTIMYYNVLLLITRYYYGVLHSTLVYYTALLLSTSAIDVEGGKMNKWGLGKE